MRVNTSVNLSSSFQYSQLLFTNFKKKIGKASNGFLDQEDRISPVCSALHLCLCREMASRAVALLCSGNEAYLKCHCKREFLGLLQSNWHLERREQQFICKGKPHRGDRWTLTLFNRISCPFVQGLPNTSHSSLYLHLQNGDLCCGASYSLRIALQINCC